MTVTLVKPYALNLDPHRDIVVVLRRYEESTHPWGVHVVTVDFAATHFLQHRTIGLFTDDQVLTLARTNKVDVHDPFLYAYEDDINPLQDGAAIAFENYIWTQVVPMEWHGGGRELHRRLGFLAWPSVDDFGYEPYELLTGWMAGGWKPLRPALRIVELPA